MGFYHRVLLPRLCDKMAGTPEMAAYRKQVLAPARGQVLEIGFGTGLNTPHYPRAVERIVGLDPNDGAARLRDQRMAAASVPVEFHVGSAEALPFPDGSFDTVVTTLVLCAIPEVERALAECRRVLRPGGGFLFLEHGLSPEPEVQKTQRRWDGVHTFLVGCHLDRDTRKLIDGAGFAFAGVQQFYVPKAPRFAGYFTLGHATRS
jgi:ubiquinone/menaquinone biosynthesis C-methylase UbiE